ncbi:Hermansky-Pudlak syndrome 4 protein-like [Asterias rubens]|uniref:Hermansky-Pudlak syndrome 4 protein-like n=1 Tax=Asterias rubens TaxID=7604 RepID=UPI001455ABF4|nr:Hermansky-Pudlak syndrome 4 protein-like [Asterias rubens]
MAASFAMGPGDRIFFIYDRSVVKKEEDDPKDAIVYFYPQTTTLDMQCIFCCQIVGMYNLTKSITGSTPKLFKLRRSKVATVHEGKFTLALACKLRTPDAAIINKLENLYRVFAFYHCSITNVQRISGTKEAFISNMSAIWDFYVPYVRRYGNTVPGIFEPIQSIRLLKGGNFLFLRCSHLLQWMKSQSSLLAGCILYRRSVLCTQLTPELTSHLLLIKPNQHHHPSQSVTDTVLPFGVRIMSVYVTKQQYRQILTPTQPSSKSTSCATPEDEDVFHTPPTSLTEKVDGKTLMPNGTPAKPKRKLKSSKAGTLLSNFSGILDGTVWQTTPKSGISRSQSSSGGKKGGSLKGGSPSESPMKDVNDVVLSRNSGDVVVALQAEEGFPANKLSGIAYQECQTSITSKNSEENEDTRKVLDAVDCSVTLPNSLKSDHHMENSNETGSIRRNTNGHLRNRVPVDERGDVKIIQECLTPSKDDPKESVKILQVDEEAINGSTDCSIKKSSCVGSGEMNYYISEQNTNHLHTSKEHLRNSQVPVKEATGKYSHSILESLGADRPDLLRSRSDEHRDNPDLLQSSSIKTSIRNDDLDQREVQDKNANLKCHQCETPIGVPLSPEAEDAVSWVTLGEEIERGTAMKGDVETNLLSEKRVLSLEAEDAACGVSLGDGTGTVMNGDVEINSFSEHEKLDGDDEKQNLTRTNTETVSPSTRSGVNPKALNVCKESENKENITQDIPEDFKGVSEQCARLSGVGSLEEQPGSDECYHQSVTDGDGSVGSSESDKTLQFSLSTSGIESKEEEDAAEEVEEVREQLIEAKEKLSEDVEDVRSQDSESDDAANLDESEPTLDDLVNVSLYVQAHSDTTLLFLADKSIMQEKDMLNKLWQSVLRELGELELQLKNVVRPERSLDTKSAYNFIHFDNHGQTLEGNIVNPVNQTESLFCRSCQILHDQFLGDETLTDVTLRNHQTVVCAHQNACHHTFYQRICKSNPSVGIPSRDDADFYIQNRWKDALKEQNINLL